MSQVPNEPSPEMPEPPAADAPPAALPHAALPPVATLCRRWIVGIVGSWIVVWLAGPLVLDSILVRVFNSDLGVNTLQPGDLVRWRSEGWGNTRIGPHGLPGWSPRPASHRVVLWGDSQVEGVCVDDPEKISNQVIALANGRGDASLDCLPMGRSGADARDWRDLSEPADALWHPMLHVWIVTDLSDLTALAPLDDLAPYRRWTVESPGWVKLAATLRGEAILAAGKRLLRDPQTGGLRRLHFGLGPRSLDDARQEDGATNGTGGQPQRSAADQARAVAEEVAQVAQRLGGRLAILYAPATPSLARPLTTEHPDDARFELLRRELQAHDIEVADVREHFIALWHHHRRLPRGFHNGQPGYGHLNADGNRLVAQRVLALTRKRLSASTHRGGDN